MFLHNDLLFLTIFSPYLFLNFGASWWLLQAQKCSAQFGNKYRQTTKLWSIVYCSLLWYHLSQLDVWTPKRAV